MVIENRFIHYVTIHLSRREEILVHSIIALYSSKDGFKWVNNGSDPAVVIVGSDIKKQNNIEIDPFVAIKEDQVVCVLGDIYYPKNAHGLIRIDLPIKALQLVDKLSEIEREYIQQPFSKSYIPVNHFAKPKTEQPQIIHTEKATDTLINSNGTIDFVVPSKSTQVDDPQKDMGVTTHLELFKALDLHHKESPAPVNILKPFSLELVDSLDKDQANIAKVINFNVKQLNNHADTEAFSKQESLFSPISEPVSLKDEIRLVPPTLTDVVSELPEVAARKVVNNLQVDDALLENEQEASLILREMSVQSREDSNISMVAELTQEVALRSIKDNTLETKLVYQEQKEDGARIKLLRWPKADLIQQHPGNAILASMVINIPMSVNDMAKQSDLPIPICQRFFDAVVAANVAEYVDQIKPVSEPVMEQVEKIETSAVKEDAPKKKGFLYRIRVALGLVRA